ncbi:hypothetical protein B0H17DRAFT_1152188 [Mycena rosella]|uniref:Uncharacterized protein n=1 Tax=Mycena rosella TaxID=1033263 RepID=A0AAD7BEU6_MYCRO|nr:hypothetical protein B0H17DRAFT_1152188 [Mycena rosella]
MNAAINATMDVAIDAILTSNPALWRPGGVYTFEIVPNQLPPSSPTEREAKIGFSGMPPRQALIHLHFRLHGAWIPPKRCEFCGVCHQEKFNLARCGEMDGIIAVFEYYLWRLNWLSIRQVGLSVVQVWNRENNHLSPPCQCRLGRVNDRRVYLRVHLGYTCGYTCGYTFLDRIFT